jgi:hypothetical protein
LSIFSEYADEAMKQGKVFQEAAKEKIEDAASEAFKSKFFKRRDIEKMNKLSIHRCERICFRSLQSYK